MVGQSPLRRIGAPVVAGAPAGVRIRTRIHLTEAEAAALGAVGVGAGAAAIDPDVTDWLAAIAAAAIASGAVAGPEVAEAVGAAGTAAPKPDMTELDATEPDDAVATARTEPLLLCADPDAGSATGTLPLLTGSDDELIVGLRPDSKSRFRRRNSDLISTACW